MYTKQCVLSLICTIILHNNTISAFSWKKIYNSIIPQKELKEVVYEEYILPQGTLTVKNKRGNIQIKTGWDTDKIFLKAIKQTRSPEELPLLIYKHSNANAGVILQTQYDESTVHGSIDFELLVPHIITVNIITQDGTITVNAVNNPLILQSEYGNIEVTQARNSIHATINQTGSITIHQPYAAVYAQTHSGGITIYDAQASVFASTGSGALHCHCKKVPSTAIIKLTTDSGAISLFLPPDVNASLQAETKYGTITSQQFITIKPFTTQLNKDAWKRFKKEISGTFGTGEAQIKLNSQNGFIKILEEKNN